MKRPALRLILAFLTGILTIHVVRTQQATNPTPTPKPSPTSTPTPSPPQFTQDQLEERFNQVLATELDGANIYLSFAAARKLENIVREAARKIITSNGFTQLPVADKNFKDFAKALIARAGEINRRPIGGRLGPGVPDEEIRITTSTISDILDGYQKINRLGSEPQIVPGWCPIFPICQ
jgi:hypothetical protein